MDTLQLPDEFFPTPHNSDGKPRKIVIAYDHSESSDATFAKGIRQGLIMPQDELHIVHIADQSKDWSYIFGSLISGGNARSCSTPTDTLSQARTLAESLLAELRMVLIRNGFKDVHIDSLVGDPKQSIIDCCIALKPNFLICSSRGLGNVKGAVLGSVSSYLIKNCPCPVMVVKLTDEELRERKELESIKNDRFVHVLDCLQNK
ncbi:hypothetical protein BC940DRAFT_308172 [Gongronella butleri]|nr:hypothetical protein BC940DRAFT_308172 [Gongronella butleri]